MTALLFFFFFQAEDGIRDLYATGVQTCALPISRPATRAGWPRWRRLVGASVATRRPRRSPGSRPRTSNWSGSWPSPASWWTCKQNCTRSWRRSPRARTPSRGRRHDRPGRHRARPAHRRAPGLRRGRRRSEEHTSELQSRRDLVCRLLLEKKKKKKHTPATKKNKTHKKQER